MFISRQIGKEQRILKNKIKSTIILEIISINILLYLLLINTLHIKNIFIYIAWTILNVYISCYIYQI